MGTKVGAGVREVGIGAGIWGEPCGGDGKGREGGVGGVGGGELRRELKAGGRERWGRRPPVN